MLKAPETFLDREPLEWVPRVTYRDQMKRRAANTPRDSVIQKEKELSKTPNWNEKNTLRFLELCRDPTKTNWEIAHILNEEFQTRQFTKNSLIGRLDRLREVEKKWRWLKRERL